MRRALALALPSWSTDLVRRRLRRRGRRGKSGSEPALILVRESGARQLVERACPASLAAGVRTGMTVAQARALTRGRELRALLHDPRREVRALRALAEWATRFSPLSAPDPPDGLLLDVGGCERLFGGERALLDAAADAIARLGFRVRAATASTAGCAWGVARFGTGERTVVPAGVERAALAKLPVDALNLSAETLEALLDVGVERVEHLLALERKDLVSRFGSELLLHLDRALGCALEATDPVHPLAPPRAERVFPGPVSDFEAILETTRRLLGELIEVLEKRESGARELVLELRRSDLPPLRQRLPLSRASRNARHLWSLLEPVLERAHFGFGVEGVVLVASALGPVRHRQESRWVEAGSETDRSLGRSLAELVDTFAGRLGPERTLYVDEIESHLPEEAFRRRSAAADAEAFAELERRSSAPGVTPFERPSLLLRSPEEVEVIAPSPSGPPAWLRWRGEEARVVRRFGPERIARPWWDERHRRTRGRDYFRIQSQSGRWLWVFRELETERWFVHGEWV